MGFFISFLFVIICGLFGRWVFLAIFDCIFKVPEQYPTFIDKSTHYHDNRHLSITYKNETTHTIKHKPTIGNCEDTRYDGRNTWFVRDSR